jgi:outer membrane immunogenic protein
MRLRSLAIAIPALLTAAPALAQSPIWQGVYLGIHAGGSWNRLTGEDIDVKVDPKGAIGGIHGGYNWQSGTFVFGVEGDIGASGAKWDYINGDGDKVTVKSTYLATLRARAGIATGPALLYVTGGAAFTNLNITFPGESQKHSDSGWVVGAGMEYKMTSNLALRVEGLHNRFDIDFPDGPDGKYKVNVLRAGLSYKF